MGNIFGLLLYAAAQSLGVHCPYVPIVLGAQVELKCLCANVLEQS